MRSETESDGQKRQSFIEAARRVQILESAVATLTELGYAGASLARIAEHAGISKGVISYHFAGKAELMEQIVAQVYDDVTDFVVKRMEAETTATGALRTNILSVAAYMKDHRVQLAALGEIFNTMRTADGKRRFGVAYHEPVHDGREQMFRLGQEAGEFRPFDPRVMAVAVQDALDGMFAYWMTHPEHDLDAHATELADLFEHATRAGPPGSDGDR